MAQLSDPAAGRAGGRSGKPWRAAGIALVALLALTGSGLIGAGLRPTPVQPPQPAEEAALVPATAGSQSPTVPGPTVPGPTKPGTPAASAAGAAGSPSPPAPRPAVPALPRAEPTRITIPKIKVNAKIMSLGLNADGTVQVPPLKEAQNAGWYKPGPSPGEIGNSVVVGHVDSAEIGPAVFFRLGALRRGDRIQVARKDGTVVTFTVDSVKSYPKTAFPTELVYGAADTPRLQVVTCGGTFDSKRRSYPNNIVVSATRTP
ncbi:class F sortase [Plantactinospora sp. CA-290183]|uniref:class F sortase n=1 Tax=Plantactinospora sp. CA-290183 TaxID=3240006 RepID=UPI003D94AAF3